MSSRLQRLREKYTEPRKYINQVILTGIIYYKPIIVENYRRKYVSLFLMQPIEQKNGYILNKFWQIKSYNHNDIEIFSKLERKAYIEVDGILARKNASIFVDANKIKIVAEYQDLLEEYRRKGEDYGCNENDSD